ncbi:MAG: AAA family ATPase [Corallococcus sp.]|nr:AAA family ATPase [Corallococcus sp.]
MLRRKVYDNLLKWKASRGNECLLIKGARQVGKTYLVEQFGKNEYESFIEINFLKQPALKSVFADGLSSEEIYKRMSAFIPNIRLVEGKTLIFLDEIQKCANARTALKFLAEDRRFDVIASGSLLGLHCGQDADEEAAEVSSVPVGYERQIMMYSLDFEEFLWAYGYDAETIEYIKGFFVKREKVPFEINEKFENLIREYIVIGGMPEVVVAFMKNKDFNAAQQAQDKILLDYMDDIASHAKGAEKVKVKACYDSIPRQLAKENKKFKYSEVEKKSTARKYEDSVHWLHDSNLVYICYNVTEPYLPLMANEKGNEFKLYVNDTGLLCAMYGFNTKLAVLNGTLKGNAKGGIYENLIAEMLIKNGYTLHYYKKSDSTLEIEFLIEKNAEILPVEVKSGNTQTASLNNFMLENKPSIAYKLVDGNVGFADGKLTLPHYMALFI